MALEALSGGSRSCCPQRRLQRTVVGEMVPGWGRGREGKERPEGGRTGLRVTQVVRAPVRQDQLGARDPVLKARV